MKKCPFCAEEIQDEAILCRYCKSDLTVTEEVKQERDYYELLEEGIDNLLLSIRSMSPKALSKYPLSIERRSKAIVSFVRRFEQPEYDFVQIKQLADYWMAMRKKDVRRTQSFIDKFNSIDGNQYELTLDEVLLGTALVMVTLMSKISGLDLWIEIQYNHLSMIVIWKMMYKAIRWDRIIRGVSFVGAVTNLVTNPKSPRKGTDDWILFIRAISEIEARKILAEIEGNPPLDFSEIMP